MADCRSWCVEATRQALYASAAAVEGGSCTNKPYLHATHGLRTKHSRAEKPASTQHAVCVHRSLVKLQSSKLDCLCRSLSEVPKGLRPIRTTSGRVTEAMGEEDNQLKGFGARLRWARQQCLRQTGNPHATQPTPARVGLPAACTLWLLHCCLDAVLCCLLCKHMCHLQPASVCRPVSRM